MGVSRSRRRGRHGRGVVRVQQLGLDWKTWGGPRAGAGRKRSVRSRVPHRRRQKLSGREPLHVTVKQVAGLPSLWERSTLSLVFAQLRRCKLRGSFRVVHVSVQPDHLHLVVEAGERSALTRGLQGLLIGIAKAFNRRWGRSGRVFRRYHEQLLASPRQVRNAIRYVLGNSARHGHAVPRDRPDPHSSGAWFTGWLRGSRQAPRSRAALASGRLEAGPDRVPEPAPVVRGTVWLLTRGLPPGGWLTLADVTRR